jgi:hypothetical protein
MNDRWVNKLRHFDTHPSRKMLDNPLARQEECLEKENYCKCKSIDRSPQLTSCKIVFRVQLILMLQCTMFFRWPEVGSSTRVDYGLLVIFETSTKSRQILDIPHLGMGLQAKHVKELVLWQS